MINAVNATVASAVTTSNDNGGVAVLEAPAPAAAPATTPVTPAIPVKTKRVRKPKGVAQGNIASPAARAAIVTEGQGNQSVAAAQIAVLDEAGKIADIRSPEVPATQRQITKTAALMVLIGVGLGANSGGYGPLVRSTLVSMLKTLLKKGTASKSDITVVNLRAILTLANFQPLALAALAGHIATLKGTSEGTIALRGKNKGLAEGWINTGMHASYLIALNVTKDLGDQVQFGKVAMPLEGEIGALPIAFGRNLTAAGLLKALKASMAVNAEANAAKAADALAAA